MTGINYLAYQRAWLKRHPNYKKEYYRTKVSPYFYLQFFRYVLRQQKLSKWCKEGHGIIKGYKCHVCLRLKRLKKCEEAMKRKTDKTNKAYLRRRLIKETYRENRKWVIEQLGGKCVKCGFDNILALDIHHIIKEKKPNGWSVSSIKKHLFYKWKQQGFIPPEERRNMILFCANCHRIYHGELSKT